LVVCPQNSICLIVTNRDTVLIRADHRLGRVGFGAEIHNLLKTDETKNGTTSNRETERVRRVMGMAGVDFNGWVESVIQPQTFTP
jgi:hypothetical protein